MEKKRRKRELTPPRFVGDQKNLSAHFTQQSEAGWELVKVGKLFHVYEWTDKPQKKEYLVIHCGDMGIFDTKKGQISENFRKSHEALGWTFVGQNHEQFVFAVPTTETLPPTVYPYEELASENDLKVYRRYALAEGLATMLGLGVPWWLLTQVMGMEVYFSNLLLLISWGLPLGMLANGSYLLAGFMWYLQARSKFKGQEPLPTVSKTLWQGVCRVHTLLGLLAVGLLAMQLQIADQSALRESGQREQVVRQLGTSILVRVHEEVDREIAGEKATVTVVVTRWPQTAQRIFDGWVAEARNWHEVRMSNTIWGVDGERVDLSGFWIRSWLSIEAEGWTYHPELGADEAVLFADHGRYVLYVRRDQVVMRLVLGAMAAMDEAGEVKEEVLAGVRGLMLELRDRR